MKPQSSHAWAMKSPTVQCWNSHQSADYVKQRYKNHHKSPLSSTDHFKKKNGHGNTQVKLSSTPIPKDLPPLLRARAVALSGKSVGVNIRRKCWGYRAGLETEVGSGGGGGGVKEEWTTQCRQSAEILPLYPVTM